MSIWSAFFFRIEALTLRQTATPDSIDMDHKVLCKLLDEHAPMKAVAARKLFHKAKFS